jgi:hypothetical protein
MRGFDRFVRVIVYGVLLGCALVSRSAVATNESAQLRVLFLGDNGHHQPAARFRQLQPVLAERGIEMKYTDRLGDLNPRTLAEYDGLVVYANHTTMSAEQESALVEFVEGGKGFVPLHCASACFGSSAKYVSLVGGRFSKHGFGKFRAKIIDAQHPAMTELRGFEVTDEDYTHSDIAADVQALIVRDEAGGYEPSCWTRRQGKGRVFYTALGHDEKTFGQPEFHKLVENGIRWAAGQLNDDLPPIEYVDAGAPIPNYTPGQRWGTQGENLNKIAKPLPPDLSIKHMHLPEGFRAELFAAEPDIKKPMAGSWDERGRLWIIESIDYPNKLLDDPHKNGNDQIKICEDTDGDGHADKFTVFADHLNIPTAIVHTHGGVVVACAPHLLFLKDTDGDDRADVREIILTGFGRGDTHAVTSNLRYGLDNWIWGTCGYSGGKVKVGDTEHNFRQCIFRFKLESFNRKPEASASTKGDPPPNALASGLRLNDALAIPRVSAFEVITPTSNNTWGLGFSETGDVFCSTANNQHLVHMAIPNRYFEMVRGWHGVGSAGIEDHKRLHPIAADFRQMDWHGGFTAAAGCEVYTARSFPPEYWNRAVFVCEPTARLVHIDWLVPNGSGFIAKDGWNLVASTDPWFGPVDAKVGPDGAVWILDWYNYIIQHNPTPAGFKTGRGNAYETPLRDQTHGRIYRVVYDGAKQLASGGRQPPDSPRQDAPSGGLRPPLADDSPETPRLDRAAPEQLIDALGHDNMWVRLAAQRLLVERGPQHIRTDLNKKLHELLQARAATDSAARDVSKSDRVERPESLLAQHCAWALSGLGGVDRRDLSWGHLSRGMFQFRSEGTRLAIARSYGSLQSAATLQRDDPDIAPHFITTYLSLKSSPRVKLTSLLTLSDLRSYDERLPGASFEHGDEHKPGPALAAFLNEPANSNDPWLLAAATSAAARHDYSFLRAAMTLSLDFEGSPKLKTVVRTVAEHFARHGESAAASVGTLIDDMGRANAVPAEAVLRGLAAGWPAGSRPTLNAKAEDSLASLLGKISPDGQLVLAQLAARWGMKGKFEASAASIRKSMLGRITDAKSADDARIAAARQLVAVGTDGESVKALLDLVTPAASPALSGGIIDALGESGSDDVGAAIIARWSSLTPATRRAALAVLVKRPAWSRALLDAIEGGKVESGDLASDQATTLTGHPDKAIAERAKAVLARKGRLPDPDRQKVMDEFEPITKETGDVAAGKVAFTKHCAKCHTHSGEGAKVGPDLTGMAVHPKIELLTNILDPSRSVEGNFRAYMVATKDGRVLSGLLASETKTALELFDTEGKKQVVLREDIEELAESQKSLMPDGFEKQVTREELVNLLEFLAARGKYLPLDIRKVATVVSTRGMFVNEDSDVERLIFRDWSPKTVEGVPFVLVDPQGDRVKNAILLHSENGTIPRNMPKSITLPCNAPARAIHLLSGVGGWAFPFNRDETVSMIVRLHYADGQSEDHELKNGVHFADYIRVVDVPESKLAFRLRGQQIRYLTVQPKRSDTIASIELVKGPDATAPVVMAVTIEGPE